MKVEGGVEKKEKKTWQYFELSDYKWLTYKEFATKAKAFGQGLVTADVRNYFQRCIYIRLELGREKCLGFILTLNTNGLPRLMELGLRIFLL